jgi:hypothetical protein
VIDKALDVVTSPPLPPQVATAVEFPQPLAPPPTAKTSAISGPLVMASVPEEVNVRIVYAPLKVTVPPVTTGFDAAANKP